jgi:hypothetical protein
LPPFPNTPHDSVKGRYLGGEALPKQAKGRFAVERRFMLHRTQEFTIRLI